MHNSYSLIIKVPFLLEVLPSTILACFNSSKARSTVALLTFKFAESKVFVIYGSGFIKTITFWRYLINLSPHFVSQ